jgi:hypothetical protein
MARFFGSRAIYPGSRLPRFRRVPASPSARPAEANSSVLAELVEQALELASRDGRQHLLELGDRRSRWPGLPQVAHEEGLVRLAIQAPLAGVDARLAEMSVEPSGQQEPRTTTVADSVQDPLFQQWHDANAKDVRDCLVAANEVDEQEVVGAERHQPLLSDLFEEAQELRISDVPVEGHPDPVGIGAGEVGHALAVPDALTVDEVEALPRPLDEAATAENLGDPAVAGLLIGWRTSSQTRVPVGLTPR